MIAVRCLKESPAQRQESRMKLDLDSIILPGELWWLFTVLVGVGGTILYVANREWVESSFLGPFLVPAMDETISTATDAFRAALAVMVVMFPMLPVALLAMGASPREKREIFYLVHAGFKTLVLGSYPHSSSRTFRTKVVRNLLWMGDVALAKVGASLAATTLGISLYSDAKGAHQPFVTIGCISITYLLFLYPSVIRAAMSKEYRSQSRARSESTPLVTESPAAR